MFNLLNCLNALLPTNRCRIACKSTLLLEEEEVWFWDWLPTARARCDFWKANDKMCSGSHPPHLPVHICMLISYIQRYEFSCINARNIWIISLYSVKFFHIHSVSFNAPWKGCNFVLDLEIHHESAHARENSNELDSPLAKSQTCTVNPDDTRDNRNRHTRQMQSSNVTIAIVTLERINLIINKE